MVGTGLTLALYRYRGGAESSRRPGTVAVLVVFCMSPRTTGWGGRGGCPRISLSRLKVCTTTRFCIASCRPCITFAPPTHPTPPTPIIQPPMVAVSETRLPQNQGHKSEKTSYFGLKMMYLGSIHHPRSKQKSSILRAFDHFWVPECGSFGDQVARKPRPHVFKRRVSGRK